MKKENLDIFYAPVLQIDIIKSALEKDGVVYANIITGSTKSGKKYVFRERRGIPIDQYINKPLECVLEVIDADFFYPQNKEDIKKLPDGVEEGKYVWVESGDKFIPELVEMVEGHQEEEEYEYDDDEFEKLAISSLDNWGVCGFGLRLDQNKPMVKTAEGVFLFNEYQNEEVIEEWELGQTVYFRPKEILLRGIKPYEGKWEPKANNRQEIVLKENEMIIRGKPRIIDPY